MKIDAIWLSNWKKERMRQIETFKKTGENINTVLRFAITSKWLISTLAQEGVIFKVINLGGGVKKITTDLDCCPMCKRKLKED